MRCVSLGKEYLNVVNRNSKNFSLQKTFLYPVRHTESIYASRTENLRKATSLVHLLPFLFGDHHCMGMVKKGDDKFCSVIRIPCIQHS